MVVVKFKSGSILKVHDAVLDNIASQEEVRLWQSCTDATSGKVLYTFNMNEVEYIVAEYLYTP